MKRTLLFSKTLIAAGLLFIAAGCGNNEQKTEGTMNNNMNMNHQKTEAAVDSSIIRRGNVDVANIDSNNDGNVYQCQMDYEVISDEAGSCPECGMDLEQVSVEKAQANYNNSNM